VRASDGRLSILDARQSHFIAESWLAADADRRSARDDLAQAFACDDWGCVGHLADGSKVAVARRYEAFADDCRNAALVITKLEAPVACAAPVIDRKILATTGAVALYRVGGRWTAEPAREPTAERQWYGRATPADPRALSRLEATTPSPSGISGGAQPEELELEDEGQLVGE
jgi:competence protein ComEC